MSPVGALRRPCRCLAGSERPDGLPPPRHQGGGVEVLGLRLVGGEGIGDEGSATRSRDFRFKGWWEGSTQINYAWV